MWKRKTEEDLKKASVLSNFTRDKLILAVILAGLATIIAAPVIGVFVWILFVVLFSFSCVGIFLFNDPAFITSFFLGAGAVSPQTDICNKCFSVVERTENRICKCGGKYEPIENWKWVEDTEDKPNK
jgi:hypothetical protein